jgi:integrase
VQRADRALTLGSDNRKAPGRCANSPRHGSKEWTLKQTQANAARITGHLWLYEGKRTATWYAKIRGRDGTQRNEKVGAAWREKGRPPADHFTKKAAQEWLDARLTELRQEAPPLLAASGVTFKQACDEWLRYVGHDRQRAHSTVRDYENAVACYLLPEFGYATPLADIDSDRIDAYRDRLLAGHLSRRTAQKVLVLLHGVFKRAMRKKWISVNPAENVEKVTVTRSGDFNVLTPVEVEAVARAAKSEQEAAIYAVAAYTGLRLGELRALRWIDVDFVGRKIHVRRNLPTQGGGECEPKSGKVRSVPLADQAARALESLSRRENFTDESDRVFCTATGGAIGEAVARKSFYAALDLAKLGHLRTKNDPIVFHDLRHTFGTLAVQRFPLSDVQAMMGHANVQTTMIYVHHVPKHDDADRLSNLITATTGAHVDQVAA